MTTRVTLAALLLAALCSGASAQQFIPIPTAGSWAYDITPDGEVVVGTDNNGGFIWRWKTDPMPTSIGGNEAVAISDDGTVVVGCIPDPGSGAEVAGRWTQATGWVSLGFLPNALSCPSKSNAYDVSGDGNTVVGLSWDGCSGRGFVWTQATGMLELAVLGNGSNRASAISSDGSKIGGFAQGASNRTPALWNPDTTGQVINMNIVGEMYGFSDDGSIVLGNANQNAFWMDTATLTPNFINQLTAGWQGIPMDVNDDMDQIVGFDVSGTARTAWRWTPSGGMENLQAFFTGLGMVGVPPLQVSAAQSDDGSVIIGGYGAPFNSEGFIATFVPPTWVDTGNALTGSLGNPVLVGTGELTAGSPTNLALTNGIDNTPLWLVVGFTELASPFKGGVLMPSPDIVLAGLSTDGNGQFQLPFPWPGGIPSGFKLHWQAWLIDGAGPSGFSATNGLTSTTP